MVLLLFGFSAAADLKSDCMSAGEIVGEAKHRLTNVKSENILKDGKIIGTRVYVDNSKSKEYLDLEMKAFRRHYEAIKAVYLANGIESLDALCALAVLNEYTFLLTGEAIDERCTYTKLLSDRKSEKLPSDWVLNEFYYHLSRRPGFHDAKWDEMSAEEKYEDLFQDLLVPDESGKTCLDKKT